MDTGQRTLSEAVVGWADLPVELLAKISGVLRNPKDLVRSRSVCRWWRSSIPLTDKLSLLFPLRAPWIPISRAADDDRYDLRFKATSVYIVRSKDPDPSKAKSWMVSLQEQEPGEFVLRDALLYKELKDGEGETELDKDTIASTQTLIARSYVYNERCLTCNGVCWRMKVDVIVSSSDNLVGVYSYYSSLYAFRLDLSSRDVDHYHVKILNGITHHPFDRPDLVVFNGRIFVADVEGRIYHLDQTDLELVLMSNPLIRSDAMVKFVVSDGELYLVWRSLVQNSRQVYKLIISVADELDDMVHTEEVEDLGDRVFFITPMWSSSISARLLPRPWQGNRIFYFDHRYRCHSTCKCFGKKYQHVVYDVGAKAFTPISLLQGYSDLFSPPASFLKNKDPGS